MILSFEKRFRCTFYPFISAAGRCLLRSILRVSSVVAILNALMELQTILKRQSCPWNTPAGWWYTYGTLESQWGKRITGKFHSVALLKIEIEIWSFLTDILPPKKLTEPSGNMFLTSSNHIFQKMENLHPKSSHHLLITKYQNAFWQGLIVLLKLRSPCTLLLLHII